VFSLLVLVMFVYILLTPLGISFAIRRAEPAGGEVGPDQMPPSLDRFALDGLQVGDILDRSRNYPDQSMTVKAFAESWLIPEQHDYVVVNEGDLAGIVSLGMLRYLPRSEWGRTRLQQVLRHNTPHVSADEFIEDSLQQMTENSLTVLPVKDAEDGKFIGSISSHEVVELIVLSAKGREI